MAAGTRTLHSVERCMRTRCEWDVARVGTNGAARWCILWQCVYAARLSEAKAAFQAKRGADLAAADAVLGVEARDKRAGAWPPAPPETDGDALLLRCRADALTNAAHAVRTADPAAADCADRRQKLDAALQAFHCCDEMSSPS